MMRDRTAVEQIEGALLPPVLPAQQSVDVGIGDDALHGALGNDRDQRLSCVISSVKL
jgi:hypothetical protein